jgi:mono/diheme cytochrome c family protein
MTIALGAALLMPWRASAEDGAAVYKAQCAKCHGDTGEADTPAAKTLKVPKLKGDAKVGGMAVPDIVAAVKANEKHKSFIKKLSDEQITAAAGQAKQLAGAK